MYIYILFSFTLNLLKKFFLIIRNIIKKKKKERIIYNIYNIHILRNYIKK